jgi:CheY-like chemotaxis protein
MSVMVTTEVPQDILAGWTVLVLDDDPDALDIVTMLLSFYGANVVTAINGREGLEAMKKYRPRFVIADLSMPEMTGWEMVNVMKNDRTLLEIPVVALTAHAMPGDRTRAMAMGFHNYLTKPLRPETFVNDLLLLLTADIPELAQLLEPGKTD